MTADAVRARAARFLALHRGSRTLVLPNAWDGGSAPREINRLFAR